MTPYTETKRPMISLIDGKIKHNGNPTDVILRQDSISIGCTDITPNAAMFIIEKWKSNFSKVEVIILDK